LKGVLATGWYILGNEVKEFETSFAKWDTILHWYRNGLDALVLIFKAYIQLGNYKKGMKLLFLQIPILLVFSLF
jgi:dTDP-4-amino-4,6-dideoxygalactose transaminase